MLLAGLASVGSSGSASAQRPSSEAPPGNSAVDQYRESLPPASSNRRELSRRDRDALRREGPDGRALAAVLERTGGVPRDADAAPSGGTSDGRGDSPARRGGGERGGRAAGGGTTGPTSARDGGTGDGSRSVAPAAAASTVGPVPVWALLVAAVALVGVGLALRVRTSRQP